MHISDEIRVWMLSAYMLGSTYQFYYSPLSENLIFKNTLMIRAIFFAWQMREELSFPPISLR